MKPLFRRHPRLMFWVTLALLGGLAFWLRRLSDRVWYSAVSPSVGLTSVEPDTRPAFGLTLDRPFVIELGRGSGWHGLETVELNEFGRVLVTRLGVDPRTGEQGYESATLQAPADALKVFIDFVNAGGFTRMARSYSDPNMADGTQWILSIRQPPAEKSVYFNNVFPRQIEDFAAQLDALVKASGSDSAQLTPSPRDAVLKSQEAIWALVR